MTHTTYYIEDSNGDILNWFGRLKDAKAYMARLINVLDYPSDSIRIVCLKGPYKYEGRHAYILYFDGQKFFKIA